MATIIDEETLTNVDITGDTITLTYAHPISAKALLVLPRVDLIGITGSGQYRVSAQLLGGNVTPISVISFASGQTAGTLQGRHLSVKAGDVVTITVRGRSPDTNVTSITTTLIDATPIRQDEFDEILDEVRSIGGGAGSVEIGHNYGGKDKYAYWKTGAGPGVGDATVLAYRAEDYNAGKRGDQFVVGTTTTDNSGRWRRTLMLDPGDYVLFYYKTGAYGPDTANLKVA